MRGIPKRAFIYALLFTFLLISMLDRINMNSFGILAPIVTGYLVNSTGNFTIAFVICGILALVGALIELFLVRGSIGERAATPNLAPSEAAA